MIKHWMDTMCLKMNPSKTEFIYFGNKPQLKKCLVSDLNIAGDLVLRSHTIKYLGAHLDENLNYKQHVDKKVSGSYVQLFQDKEYQEDP